jgi:hypothetical protein
MTLKDYIEECIKTLRQRYEFSDGMVDCSFDVLAEDIRKEFRECAEKTVEVLHQRNESSADWLGTNDQPQH